MLKEMLIALSVTISNPGMDKNIFNVSQKIASVMTHGSETYMEGLPSNFKKDSDILNVVNMFKDIVESPYYHDKRARRIINPLFDEYINIIENKKVCKEQIIAFGYKLSDRWQYIKSYIKDPKQDYYDEGIIANF